MNKINKLLLLLVFVGIVLRFYRFGDTIGWWGDAARDYLVALHLAKFNETLLVGHFATGLAGGFYHPPYYYYFISLLIRIFESPFFATGFFTLLHSLSIFTMYGIGKELYDRRVGLLSAGFFALSAKMVNTSRGLISANATLPLVMLSLLFYIKGIKNAHKGYVCLALTLLFIAGSFWYGAFTLLPYMLILAFWKFRSQNRFLITLVIYIFVGLMVVVLPLVLYFGIDRVIAVFLPQSSIRFDFSLFGSFIDIVQIYFIAVFDQNSLFAIYGAVFLLLLTLFLVWKSPCSLSKLILPTFAVVYIALLGSLRRGEFLVHYLTPYEPILFLVAGYLLAKAFRYAQGSRLLQICVIGVGGALLLIISNNFSYIKYIPSDYRESREVADLILSQVGRSSFQVTTSAPDTSPGWESPTLWYFLERDTQTRLVHTVNYGENLEENNQEYVYRIFVCKNFNSLQEDFDCYEKLYQRYPQYTFIRAITYQKNYKYVIYVTRISS